MNLNIARCVMTDAIEGPAIAYWAEVRNVKRAEDNYVSSFEVRDGGFEDARESDQWVLITEEKVKDGATALLNGSVKVSRDIAKQFVGGDDWDYDQSGVDCVVQAIAFNKIVFG